MEAKRDLMGEDRDGCLMWMAFFCAAVCAVIVTGFIVGVVLAVVNSCG